MQEHFSTTKQTLTSRGFTPIHTFENDLTENIILSVFFNYDTGILVSTEHHPRSMECKSIWIKGWGFYTAEYIEELPKSEGDTIYNYMPYDGPTGIQSIMRYNAPNKYKFLLPKVDSDFYFIPPFKSVNEINYNLTDMRRGDINRYMVEMQKIDASFCYNNNDAHVLYEINCAYGWGNLGDISPSIKANEIFEFLKDNMITATRWPTHSSHYIIGHHEAQTRLPDDWQNIVEARSDLIQSKIGEYAKFFH